MIIDKAKRLNQVSEYYFVKKLGEVRALNAQGKDVINLGIGDPDLPASEATVEALAQSAANPRHHGYQPYRSIPELRQAMSRWYSKVYGVELDPETEVLPLLGSKEGVFHVCMAFLNPGDKVLVPNPGYPAYAAAARLVGAEPVFYDLCEKQGWLPDLDSLSRQVEGVKLMWLNYPNMPTGALATAEEFRKLVDFARQHQILLVHDNPYSLVLNVGRPVSILSVGGAKDVCLELNSLSKSHNMAGWRVGMICGGKDYLDAVISIKSNLDSGMFLPVQHAAIQALENLEEWHQSRNDVYHRRRELIYGLLDLLQCSYAKGAAGMFVWGRVPDHISNVEAFLDDILYNAHVFLTPGKIFGTNGERYVRISVCAPEENIKKALTRIQDHITVEK